MNYGEWTRCLKRIFSWETKWEEIRPSFGKWVLQDQAKPITYWLDYSANFKNILQEKRKQSNCLITFNAMEKGSRQLNIHSSQLTAI